LSSDVGRVRPVDTVLAAVGLAILTNGPSIAISHLYDVPLGWERWPYMIPMGMVALLGVFLSGRDLKVEDLRRCRWPVLLLGAYLLWCIASVTWSVAPDATAVRSLLTSGVAAFGLWFGLHLRFREQLLSIFGAAAALSLWSLVLILVQPHTHLSYPPSIFPNWHTEAFGVFGNPNSLGPVAAIAVLSSIGVWVLYPARQARFVALVVAAVGVVLTIWSQSVTAIVALIVAVLVICACALLLPLVRRVSGWIVGGSIVVSLAVLWKVFFDHLGRLAPLVGAESTLSSRRLIWSDVRSAIALRPWRGYGFFAYWDDQNLTASTYQHIGIAYGSAHNSVLEVALGLGRVGLVLYVALALFMVVGISRAVWVSTTMASVAWMATLVFLVVQNSMESFVLWHSYLWALFVAATVVPSRLLTVRRPAEHLDGDAYAESDDDESPLLLASTVEII
jgi:exopolysaccharide production protein ExoQ